MGAFNLCPHTVKEIYNFNRIFSFSGTDDEWAEQVMVLYKES